jgi:hypothetical protein
MRPCSPCNVCRNIRHQYMGPKWTIKPEQIQYPPPAFAIAAWMKAISAWAVVDILMKSSPGIRLPTRSEKIFWLFPSKGWHKEPYDFELRDPDLIYFGLRIQ